MSQTSYSKGKNSFAFGRKNYTFMLIGITILLAGFIIMTLDNEQHGFGFLGLTLGPLVVMAGFLFQFYAIFAKDNSQS